MDKYNSIKELSASAYDFVQKIISEDVADGRYELGGGVFSNVMSYETKMRKDLFFEAHKQYIDIQIIIEGCEIISAEHIDVMHKYACVQPFGDGDTELYEGNSEGVDHVLNKYDFVILHPEDAHMPCVCAEEPQKVRKAVIKVPVKQ